MTIEGKPVKAEIAQQRIPPRRRHALSRRWPLPAPRLPLLYLCLALLLPPVTASAHQQRAAVTRVLFNPNTGNMEVMHRFLVHDAEHAATLVFGKDHQLLESPAARRLFGDYVTTRFTITAEFADGSHRPLPLNYVGEEVEGRFLWVYQEAPQPAPSRLTGLTVTCLMLRDIWPDQHNLVNIERNGQIHSLVYPEAVEELSAVFDL